MNALVTICKKCDITEIRIIGAHRSFLTQRKLNDWFKGYDLPKAQLLERYESQIYSYFESEADNVDMIRIIEMYSKLNNFNYLIISPSNETFEHKTVFTSTYGLKELGKVDESIRAFNEPIPS